MMSFSMSLGSLEIGFMGQLLSVTVQDGAVMILQTALCEVPLKRARKLSDNVCGTSRKGLTDIGADNEIGKGWYKCSNVLNQY